MKLINLKVINKMYLRCIYVFSFYRISPLNDNKNTITPIYGIFFYYVQHRFVLFILALI